MGTNFLCVSAFIILQVAMAGCPLLPLAPQANARSLAEDSLKTIQKASPKAPWSFGANAYYGAVIRYRNGLPLFDFTNLHGVEVYANLHTIGKHRWERQYNHPHVGFALSYFNYGVPDELGKAVSLTTYLDNTLWQFKKSSLRFNLGTGLVYSTRHYTPGSNEQNLAISSKFAFELLGTVRYEFPVQERVFINLNLAFRHFSNGALNKPNHGMNFPMVGVGVRYQPREVRLLDVQDTLASSIDKRLHFNLRLAGGVKEVLRADEKSPIYSLSVYASKRLTQTNTLLIGADGFLDQSLEKEFVNNGLSIPNETLDKRLAGLTVGHELHMDKLSILFQLGRYIYQPYDLYPNYYQRYGLKYMLSQNFSAGIMLLAHTRSAHVIEWGFGLHL